MTGSGDVKPSNKFEVIELQSTLEEMGDVNIKVRTHANDPCISGLYLGDHRLPKGVLHAHRAIIGRQPASKYWFDLRARMIELFIQENLIGLMY